MHRRDLLGAGSAALALSALPSIPARAAAPALAPIRATVDRIIDISVCTRPFRPQGPRIEAQRLHGKTVVHHYGHGGSGWSLSWGSAQAALPLVQATRETRVAVIGCGAIGLTTARVLQQAGLRVRIYAKERPPLVSSSNATGLWTPESRICAAQYATPEFAQRWEQMTRASFKIYQSLLGVAGTPVEWRDGYLLWDQAGQPLHDRSDEPDYPDLGARIADIHPQGQAIAAGDNPFKVAHARRFTQMTFNIASYQRMLLEDFFREGGEITQKEFTSPRQFAGLRERTLVNCTGYGARALMGDDTLVPVKGQTAKLIPQPEVDYAIIYRGHNLVVVPRRDGILVAAQGEHDFGNDDTRVDRELSYAAVRQVAALFAPAAQAATAG